MTTRQSLQNCIAAACLAIFFEPALSASPNDEECIFDQDDQYKVYLELEQKYAGSRYVQNEYKLLIPDGDDEITLRRGGCVHFGISIELRTSITQRYDDESVLLNKVMHLVAEYGQGLVNIEMLERSLKAENIHVTRDNNGVYYLLPYPDATFEMFLRHDQDHTILGISFYN